MSIVWQSFVGNASPRGGRGRADAERLLRVRLEGGGRASRGGPLRPGETHASYPIVMLPEAPVLGSPRSTPTRRAVGAPPPPLTRPHSARVPPSVYSPMRHTHLYTSDCIPAVPGEARFGQTRRLPPSSGAGMTSLERHEDRARLADTREALAARLVRLKLEHDEAATAQRKRRQFYLASHTERREMELGQRLEDLQSALRAAHHEREELRRQLEEAQQAKEAELEQARTAASSAQTLAHVASRGAAGVLT